MTATPKPILRQVGERTISLSHLEAHRLAPRMKTSGSHGLHVIVDVLRNGSSSHAVAPYSLRALPGAPIAIPLDWDEALDSSFRPQRITIDNVFRRLAQKADPWADRPVPTHTIAEALAAFDR